MNGQLVGFSGERSARKRICCPLTYVGKVSNLVCFNKAGNFAIVSPGGVSCGDCGPETVVSSFFVSRASARPRCLFSGSLRRVVLRCSRAGFNFRFSSSGCRVPRGGQFGCELEGCSSR